MNWIDISLALSEDLPAWPSDDMFRYWETTTIRAGDHANCAHMSLSVHYGTHIDAPYHFIEGAKTVDELEPDMFIGPCLVIDLRAIKDVIDPPHLAPVVPDGTRRLLVRTRNSEFVRDTSFHEDFVAFSEASARLLVEKGVRLLGIDYFSIGPYKRGRPAHLAYLSAGGAAIEGLDLGGVDPGLYEICCLPLKIKGSGGAPARVFIRHLT